MEIQTQKRYNRITESCCIPYRLWELLVCAVCFGLAMAILFERYPSSMAKWMFLSTSFAFFLICFFDIIGYLIKEPIPGHSTWIMFCTMACFIFGTVSGIIIFQGIAKAPVILKVGLAFAIIAVAVFLFDLIHILCKLGRVPNNAVKEQKPKPKSVMKKTQVTPATSEEKFCRKCKKRCNIDETCSDPKCTTNTRYRNANENIFEPEPEISKKVSSKACSKFPVEPIEEEKLKPHLCDDPECPVVKKYKQMRQKQLEQQQEQEPEVGKNAAPIASSRPVMKIENEQQQLPPKEINEPQKPTKKRLACESCNKPCNADTGSVCEEEECSERRRLKELQEFEQQLEDVMRKYTASLASSIPPAKQNQNISVRNVENQARIPVREDKERAFQNQRIQKFGSRDETTQFPPLQKHSAESTISQRKQIPDSRHRSAPATTKELEKVRKQQPYYAAKKRNGLDSESSAGSIPDSVNTDKQEREASPLFQQIPPNSSGSPSLGSISPKQVEYKSITSPSVKTSNYGQKSARSEPGKMKGCVCMNKYCPECATTTGMCTKYKKHTSVPTSAQERANVKKDYRFQDTHLPGSMPD